jgi:hypothetical protein
MRRQTHLNPPPELNLAKYLILNYDQVRLSDSSRLGQYTPLFPFLFDHIPGIVPASALRGSFSRLLSLQLNSSRITLRRLLMPSRAANYGMLDMRRNRGDRAYR